MNDALKMQISAYIDGELPTDEMELLTRRLSQDIALRAQVDRYLRVGRLMRGEAHQAGIEMLRTRITTALADETQVAADDEMPARTNWRRPAAGFAIAASVALVALLGLRQMNLPEAPGVQPATATAAVEAREMYTEPVVSEVLSDRPSEMLMQYYLSHGATSSDLGANGILTRLVTLEMRGDELVRVPPADSGLAPDAAPAENGADETDPTGNDE